MTQSTAHSPQSEYFIVGVGASAGGLEAIEIFFDNLPDDTGAAYVIVQHLSPDFKSLMDQLLARHTKMQIHRAEEGMSVEPNNIYLIPPRKNMRVEGRALRLSEQSKDRTPPLPIDIFLTSLAEDVAERAIGVILSGTGSDGSSGVRAIKEAGGVVIVQDPESAKFDGMPQAAIHTGAADLILSPKAMGPKIASYIATPSLPLEEEEFISTEPMRNILQLLKKRHNVDFSVYKEKTIHRRILRRMTLMQCETLDEFFHTLRENAGQVDYLYEDLLIGVTEFFRDTDAFQLIEEHLDHIVNLADEHQIRIWCPGSSTGEEPYSIAMLLEEYRQRTGRAIQYKIFATDVDPHAIARAGEGIYSASVVAKLGPERLNRFFDRQADDYRVGRLIRDHVVFAHHNIFKDPPFTRIHLVTCRNMLIYMKPEVQADILRFLHFALVPKGILMLGPSETPGDIANEFTLLNQRWKLYRKKRDTRLPLSLDMTRPQQRPTATPFQAKSTLRSHQDFDRICSAFISEFVPTAMLTDENGNLLHTFGDARRVLLMPQGRASLQLLDLLGNRARTAVATAMHSSHKTGSPVRYEHVPLEMDDGLHEAKITVRHLPPSDEASSTGLFLVLFGNPEAVTEMSDEPETYDRGSSSRIAHLEQELQHTKENLQATIEELETANEELQSTNEELLASNEELQSTNEELHSVNEELYTVNAEHQRKITELSELTEDVENLLSSIEVGTIFLDEELRIRKFTPQAEAMASLMPSDIGRPLSHLSHGLEDIDLVQIAEQVARSGQRIEQPVSDKQGTQRLLRVLPYRSDAGHGGVLVTLIDLTALDI
jgi:two-component system CheB/CheR fusion protein